MTNMNLSRKDIIKILLIAIAIFLVVFYMPLNSTTENKLALQFYQDLNVISLAENQKNFSAKDWYDSIVVWSTLESVKGKKPLQSADFMALRSKLEKAFENACYVPENCNPYYYLLPYCILQERSFAKAIYSEIEYKESLEKPAFKNSLEFWRNYFKNKEALSEDDLEMLYGYLLVEEKCGKSTDELKKTLKEKILNTKVSSADAEKLLRNCAIKVSLYRIIIGNENLYDDSHYNILEDICEKPKDISLDSINNVCSFNDYLTVKIFCNETTLNDAEKEKFNYFANRKYHSIKEIVCHLGVLNRKKLFQI